MKQELKLSWAIYTPPPGGLSDEYSGMNRFNKRREHTQGGHVSDPCWLMVREKLDICLKNEGTVSLNIVSASGNEKNLEVQADNGRYLIMLGEETPDNYVVRGFESNTDNTEKVAILGDLWHPKAIGHDPALVVAVFKEFYETGDVSREILK